MPPTQVTPLDQGICGIWLKAVPLYQNISILGHIQVLDQQKKSVNFLVYTLHAQHWKKFGDEG